MSDQITTSELISELTSQEQQLLTGGSLLFPTVSRFSGYPGYPGYPGGGGGYPGYPGYPGGGGGGYPGYPGYPGYAGIGLYRYRL